jgi:hypothetical protein
LLLLHDDKFIVIVSSVTNSITMLIAFLDLKSVFRFFISLCVCCINIYLFVLALARNYLFFLFLFA